MARVQRITTGRQRADFGLRRGTADCHTLSVSVTIQSAVAVPPEYRSRLQLPRFSIRCLALLGSLVLAATHGTVSPARGPTPPEVDEPLSVLASPRAEEDLDQLDAAALYATGRLLQRQGEQHEQQEQMPAALRQYGKALQSYQRAFRRDPRATTILSEIISLAQVTSRLDEAVRYAIIAVERDASDSVLVRWLALYLTEQGDWQRALGLYDTLIAQGERDNHSGAHPDPGTAVWLEMGRLAYLTEDFAKASAAFSAVESALARTPTSAADKRTRAVLLENARLVYQLFGEAHLAAGNLEAAEAAFRTGHERDGERGPLDYHLARVARRQKAPELARERLEAYFASRQPVQGMAPYRLLAELLTDRGQDGALLARLEELRESDPDSVPLACFLAERYLEQDKLEPAERIYRSVLTRSTGVRAVRPEAPADVARIAPEDLADATAARGTDELHNKALRGLAAIYRRRGDAAALLEILAVAAHEAGSLEPLQEERLEIAADKRLLDDLLAARKCGSASTVEPGTASADRSPPDRPGQAEPCGGGAETFQPGAALALAQLAVTAKRLDVAARHFDQALAEQPDHAAATLLEWGIALLEEADYQGAAGVFQKGIDARIGPRDPAARDAYQAGLHFYQAGAFEMIGATDQALAAARRASELQPDSALIASREPWISGHAGRHADARAGYQRLIDNFDTDHRDSRTREILRAARFELSELCVCDGDLSTAEEWLEQVLDEDPENVAALNDLGYLWADRGAHLHRALGMIEKAVAAEPDNPAYRDSLGWAYFRLGRYEAAVQQLEMAVATGGGDGIILDHLGDCHERLGRRARAEHAWTRAVEALTRQGRADEAARVQKKIGRPAAPGVAVPDGSSAAHAVHIGFVPELA